MAAGWNCSAAITSEGELFMWGDNSMGQLGIGDKVPEREKERNRESARERERERESEKERKREGDGSLSVSSTSNLHFHTVGSMVSCSG